MPERVEANQVWVCESCNTGEMDTAGIMQHLASFHKVVAPKGRRKLTAHIDCQDSFTNQYEWDIQGIVVIETHTIPRGPRRHMSAQQALDNIMRDPHHFPTPK